MLEKLKECVIKKIDKVEASKRYVMHILYIHQYFTAPSGSSGTRSYEFARRWVQAGNEVTIITSTAQLSAKELENSEKVKKGVRRLKLNGIDVLVLEVSYHQTMGYVRRGWSLLQFLLRASFLLLQLKGVDVVYATSTPITVAVPALIKRVFSRTPFIFEVRDLWPEGLIALGVVKNKVAIFLLNVFEKHIYLKSSGIVALSPAMKAKIDVVSQEPSKTITVPNCADIELFKPLSKDQKHSIRKQLGWDGKFVIVHTGAMGKINGLDRIINTAEHLRNQQELLFVLLGEGSKKAMLTKLVEDRRLNNVEFINRMPKSELAKILPAADVGLVSVTTVEHMLDNSANKFFDYLACGLPVLLNYGGWQKAVLDKHNVGLGCRNFNDAEFVDNILTLLRDTRLCEVMGQNARVLAENEFNRNILAQKVLHHLLKSTGCMDRDGGREQ